jgi:uncharacterized protein YdeI (YjbR/CyaY-like superfamily)
MSPSRPVSFATSAALRAWYSRHAKAGGEIFIRCWKEHAREKGVTHRQALDEALAYGWIDGVRRGLDDDSFVVRFTPRKPGSKWSAVNLRRAAELESEGRMTKAGLAAFHGRERKPTGYSFESPPATLPPAFVRRLKANRAAWADFAARPPGYRRLCAFWIMSAKQEPTRERRLETLIASSAAGKPVPPLRWTKPARSPRRAGKRAR